MYLDDNSYNHSDSNEMDGISVVLMGVSYPGIIGMTRIEGDNLQEKQSRKEQRMDRQQHYEELESRHDAKALERFRRPAYQSVSVAEYLARKYDITAEVDTGGQGHFD